MKIERYKCEYCGYVKRHIDMHDEECCYDCWDLDTNKPKSKKLKKVQYE